MSASASSLHIKPRLFPFPPLIFFLLPHDSQVRRLHGDRGVHFSVEPHFKSPCLGHVRFGLALQSCVCRFLATTKTHQQDLRRDLPRNAPRVRTLSWHCTLQSQEAELHQQTLRLLVYGQLQRLSPVYGVEHHQQTLRLLYRKPWHCTLQYQEAEHHQQTLRLLLQTAVVMPVSPDHEDSTSPGIVASSDSAEALCIPKTGRRSSSMNFSTAERWALVVPFALVQEDSASSEDCPSASASAILTFGTGTSMICSAVGSEMRFLRDAVVLDHLKDCRRGVRHWDVDILVFVRFFLYCKEAPCLCPFPCTLAAASVHVWAERPSPDDSASSDVVVAI